MIPFRLVLRNLFGGWLRGLRGVLTILSVAVAVFLICVLRSFVTTLDAAVNASATDRIIVQSAVSLFVDLPEAYRSKLESVDGVERVCHLNWFGGTYKEKEPPGSQFAIRSETFLETYGEIEFLEGSAEQFRTQRNSCIVGRSLAKRYGFKVGQQIPVQSELYTRTDGRPWTFVVAGIYRSTSPNVDEITLYFHYDYLQEAREAGAARGPDGVSVFVVSVEDGSRPIDVMRTIDELYENGPQRVQATSEAAFQSQFVSMLGNVPFLLNTIGIGVLVAIMLAPLNTMLMAAREQTRDIGILKALGFSDGSVFGMMLTQSLILSFVGGAIGLALAVGAVPALAEVVGTMFPGLTLRRQTLVLAGTLIVALGLVAGLTPAFRARRMKAVEAISRRA